MDQTKRLGEIVFKDGEFYITPLDSRYSQTYVPTDLIKDAIICQLACSISSAVFQPLSICLFHGGNAFLVRPQYSKQADCSSDETLYRIHAAFNKLDGHPVIHGCLHPNHVHVVDEETGTDDKTQYRVGFFDYSAFRLDVPHDFDHPLKTADMRLVDQHYDKPPYIDVYKFVRRPMTPIQTAEDYAIKCEEHSPYPDQPYTNATDFVYLMANVTKVLRRGIGLSVSKRRELLSNFFDACKRYHATLAQTTQDTGYHAIDNARKLPYESIVLYKHGVPVTDALDDDAAEDAQRLLGDIARSRNKPSGSGYLAQASGIQSYDMVSTVARSLINSSGSGSASRIHHSVYNQDYQIGVGRFVFNIDKSLRVQVPSKTTSPARWLNHIRMLMELKGSAYIQDLHGFFSDNDGIVCIYSNHQVPFDRYSDTSVNCMTGELNRIKYARDLLNAVKFIMKYNGTIGGVYVEGYPSDVGVPSATDRNAHLKWTQIIHGNIVPDNIYYDLRTNKVCLGGFEFAGVWDMEFSKWLSFIGMTFCPVDVYHAYHSPDLSMFRIADDQIDNEENDTWPVSPYRLAHADLFSVAMFAYDLWRGYPTKVDDLLPPDHTYLHTRKYHQMLRTKMNRDKSVLGWPEFAIYLDRLIPELLNAKYEKWADAHYNLSLEDSHREDAEYKAAIRASKSRHDDVMDLTGD